MNPTARTCPACQQPLPADAPQGLCPQCLAKSALGSQPGAEETVASGSKPGGSGPATIQPEIARLFPQLEILEPLGQGGMGMVYKARQPQLDRVVALKVMRADLSRDPAFAERFAREARALAKLNHPNIVSVFDFGQSGGHCWFLMEFVDGRNLRELLRTKTLTPREALGIVPKVCDALQYAHDEGIVHRDIKPENILLDKKGRVKIADFGLAKLVGKDASDFSLTATGMTLGTPRYMAPEQFDKPQEVDHRADIYSLGVVLYEMLTGEVPMGRFAPPSATVGVDVRLDEVVLRSLEKEPSRRYQHASEVKTQVESIAGVIANLPPQMRQAFGFEYKSQTEWFGLPVLHICSGVDPTTGKPRVAKGIIAIGDKARGGVALGGVATGVLAFGGVAVGVFALGGTALGLFSFGGFALALIFATGGIAVGTYAFGGITLGYMAVGGVVFGVHAAGGNADDPFAREFYERFHLWRIWACAFVLSMASLPASYAAVAWARRNATPAGGSPLSPPSAPAKEDVRAKLRLAGIGLLLVGIINAFAGMIWIGHNVSTLADLWQHGAPWGWQLAHTLISLSYIVVVYYQVGVGLWLMNPDDDGDPTFVLVLSALCPPGCVLGLPVAIYAFMQLTKPEGKTLLAALRAKPEPQAPTAAQENQPPSPPDFRQQDAREILALVMTILSGLSVVGVIAAVIGLARVIFPALRTDMELGPAESLGRDAFQFGGILALSLMALFLLPKARRQGRDRLARINAANLVIVGALLTFACGRHWFGLAVPYWLGGIYSVVAFVCWIILRGRDVKAAFAGSAGEANATAQAIRGKGVALIVVVIALLGGIGSLVFTKQNNLAMKPDTFAGLHAPFVNGASGPELDAPFIRKMDFTPLQVVELNKTFQAYYREFLSLERRHTEVTRDAQGHVHIAISPFPEESLALAQRMAQELRGLVGRDVIPAPQPGMLTTIGLFRHAGEATVAVELWKESGYYHFKEERIGATNAAHMNEGAKAGRSTSSDKLHEAIPEAYRVYWKEGSATGVPAKDAQPASAATDLLRQVNEKYGKLSTFSASGKVVTVVTPTNGTLATTLEHTFALNLARPEFYRVEWTNGVKGLGTLLTGAAWSAGDGHKVLMNGNVSTFLNRELALAAATGISGGAAHTVPSLFFKDEEGSLTKSLTNATLLAEESVGKDLCHVVTGSDPVGQYTLWITKKDLFLKQARTTHAANSPLGDTAAVEPVSPETMKKLMKTLGQDSSPEGMSRMTKLMADMKQKAGAMRITITETFERIAVNELMIKEDFEVTVPAGAAAPAAPNPSPAAGSGLSAKKREQPIFYTFSGVTHFTRGPDGPQLLKAFADELKLNELQTAEVNKIIPRYYRDFVALERQHTTFTNDATGQVQITITPFAEDTIALAKRMNAEIRGTIGKEILYPDLPGNLVLFGLFRHCGEVEIKTKLWKEGGLYRFEEKHGTMKFPGGGTRSGASRANSGKDWKWAFPEEYWIYWTEK